MNKKGLIMLVLCVVMTMGLLSGCQNKDKGNTGGEKETAEMFGDFSAETFDGKEIDQKVFADSKLTVVNIWGTFCGPCIAEMPDLGELAKEYESKKVNFIGIPIDVNNDEGIKSAKQILSESEAEYTQIKPNDSLVEAYLSNVLAVPETLLINSKGEIVEVIQGARSKEEWKTLIDKVLSQQ